jgi:arginyl-tRNA synthetase
MLSNRITKIIEKALPQKIDFVLSVPHEKKFGDMACNAGLILAKKLQKNPREVATKIAQKLESNKLIQKIEIAGPGFLNLFLAPNAFHQTLKEIEKEGTEFGKVNIGKNEKILIEFISANPTGPLTIANGRGGFGGDVLARVLTRAGYAVSREFYVNDAGKQIEILGKSILESGNKKLDKDENLYQGEYIKKLAKKYTDKISDDAYETGRVFAKILLKEEIEPSVEKMGIKFDKWFSEYKLRNSGGMEKTYKFLADKKLTYEKEGALWLHTSQFGDDKDRVIKKSAKQGGDSTYVLPDLMYHKDKFERGFTKLIDILGADHHGYVPRLKIGVKMLGFGEVDVVITQLVKLFRDGVEVRMSKRTGNFELMDDLIDEVGMDAARWFFIMRDWNTHLNFDLNLAKKQSTDNPVFYVQYAHTRMASILKKAPDDLDWRNGRIELLLDQAEFDLIKKMSELPDLVSEVSQNYAINTLTTYARELAEAFHRFYEKCRVNDSENLELSRARLRLVASAKEVLRIILEDLVGVSAPVRM